MSVQNLQRSPQDTSSFYLAHIYQELSTQSNGSQPSIPSSLTDPIEPFVPPTSAVWVNGLWFLSLVIGLTCALVALLLQQWARRYLQVAYPDYKLHKQARIRAFYRHGVEKLRIPLVFEVIPVLLHGSLFLFFAGLSVYLFGVHRTIFKVVTAWVGFCAVSYAYVTVLPIIHKSNPFSTPLSSTFSFFFTGIRFLFFRTFPRFDPSTFLPLRNRDPKAVNINGYFSPSMRKTAEKYAFKLDPDIDYRSLLRVFYTLVEDTDFEKFFEGLAHLCDSDTGKHLKLQQGFIAPNKAMLSNALIAMMNRTLSSNLAPEFVQQRRVIICTNVLKSTSLFGPWWILRRVLLGDWNRFLGYIEFGLFVQNWRDITHPAAIFYRQCVAALTTSIVRDHDDRWNLLASGSLGVSKTVLQKYVIGNGDSVLLANALLIVRQTIQTYSGSAEHHRNEIIAASSRTLEAVCRHDIRRALPELQQEFCGLWNQLVAVAQSDPPPHHGFIATTTLKNIRKLYITLHECSGTYWSFYAATDDQGWILNDPKSYPMCTDVDHLPSEPIPDLQFDEPTPDVGDGRSTPNTNTGMTPMLSSTITYPPIQPPAFPTPAPFSPSTPYYPLSAPHYDLHFVNPYSFLGAPPPNAEAIFPQPQLTLSHASNFQSGVIVQSLPPPPPPPPPPRISISSVPSVHLDNASTTSDQSGGHGKSSLAP